MVDPRVIDALEHTPRRLFVSPGDRDEVDFDAPIPIGHGQTTSQPSLVALMIESVSPGADETVLEIGTGTGYQAALLSRLARRVVTVERVPELGELARRDLEEAGIDNVEVVVGDGTLGAPEQAPFDAVVVAAAFEQVPQPLVDQLREGGRLVMPVGRPSGDLVTLYEKREGGLVELRVLCGARFVPLIGEHGYPVHRWAGRFSRRRGAPAGADGDPRC